MRLARREEMREIDLRCSRDFGVPEDQLMERAGQLMADKILELPGLSKGDRIGLFCGPGNNGGDGLVVARKLFDFGFKNIDVWKLKSSRYSVLFELNLRRLKDIKVSVSEWDPSEKLAFDFNKYQLFVDALFGTGLDRSLDSDLVKFVEKLNKQKVSVVSLDVPTGLDVNRGIKLGAAIRAVKTITCGPSKPGFYFQDGPSCCGQIEIINIGFPRALVAEVSNSTFLVGQKTAQMLLPKPLPARNKSDFGRLLLIAGSPNMKGAAILAATAAARMGVGYVTVASPHASVLKKMPPDFLQVSWKDIRQVDLKKYSAVAVGPGLGVSDETLNIIRRLKDEKIQNVVLDADALTVIAKNKLWPLPSSWILTPHAGELSRIIGDSAKVIESDRLASLKKASEITSAIVLLKGFRTTFVSGKKFYIIGSGNVALAKAGTGDVLTGFISSLLAQGLSPEKAVALGAFLHGKIADHWVKKGGSPRALMASDLPILLNRVLQTIEK